MKQIIVIRQDIMMSPGKMAAQSCHASVSALLKSKKKNVDTWLRQGQKKIILQAAMEDIIEMKKKCDKSSIVSCLISDAGMTELEPGTVTALGIGPDEEKKIDKITGSLKLMK